MELLPMMTKQCESKSEEMDLNMPQRNEMMEEYLIMMDEVLHA